MLKDLLLLFSAFRSSETQLKFDGLIYLFIYLFSIVVLRKFGFLCEQESGVLLQLLKIYGLLSRILQL